MNSNKLAILTPLVRGLLQCLAGAMSYKEFDESQLESAAWGLVFVGSMVWSYWEKKHAPVKTIVVTPPEKGGSVVEMSTENKSVEVTTQSETVPLPESKL